MLIAVFKLPTFLGKSLIAMTVFHLKCYAVLTVLCLKMNKQKINFIIFFCMTSNPCCKVCWQFWFFTHCNLYYQLFQGLGKAGFLPRFWGLYIVSYRVINTTPGLNIQPPPPYFQLKWPCLKMHEHPLLKNILFLVKNYLKN